MSFEDRDYSREPSSRPPVGRMRIWSLTTWLIVINVVVFLLDVFTTRRGLLNGEPVQIAPIWGWGYFSVYTAIYHLQLWRFITFQFLHAGFEHILFNMFSLYFFGPLIEMYLGRRRFLAFYLICGIAGPVAYVILWGLGVWGTTMPATIPLVGASAGIFGILIAAAAIAPDATVLIYGSIPAKLKTVAWVLLGIAIFTVFSRGSNAGGEAAHLGGAVVGYFLIRRPQLLNLFEYGYTSKRRRMT